MRGIVTIILSVSFIILFYSVVFGATILSPTEDQQVDSGSWITITVKPDAGEQWQTFIIGFGKVLEYDPFTKVYKTTIQVPKDVLGYRDDLIVTGVDNAGRTTDFRRRVFVKLPPNVVLQGIVAGSSVAGGLNFISLRKMPAGSKATDIEHYETEQLSVHGQYSDNVNREMTSSTAGTTYTSSNEKVATVNSEGKVTAQGLGTATITVRNGKHSATVKVVVKAYKK